MAQLKTKFNIVISENIIELNNIIKKLSDLVPSSKEKEKDEIVDSFLKLAEKEIRNG